MSKISEERFTVSTVGMRALHADREPWRLIKELIANVWDEAATTCDVEIVPDRGHVAVTVSDDGPGFANVHDAYTLLGPSPKRGRPEVRGRFNIGEKEIISIATEAKIETVGFTIYFPKSGGREIKKNTRIAGTIISIRIPWSRSQIVPTVGMLRRFRQPKNVRYSINGESLLYRSPQYVRTVKLETVIQHGIDRPMTRTHRQTTIEIHDSVGETGWLYEMGIPVQAIDSPYDVDVMQKVPLSQNRDAVLDRYLKDIYAEILTATVEHLPVEKSSETWVRQALEDDRTTAAVAKAVVEKRFGEKVVFWTPDGEANERALEAGYQIVHGRTLSDDERAKIRSAGVRTAVEMFGRDNATNGENVEITDDMKRVEKYARWLSRRLLGVDVIVRFRSWGPTNVAAQYAAGNLTFNVKTLGRPFFGSERRLDQTRLILHELAHHGDAEMPHHGKYVERLALLGAKVAELALEVGPDGWGVAK